MNSADKLWELKKLEYIHDEWLDTLARFDDLVKKDIIGDGTTDHIKAIDELNDINAQISKLLEDE